MTQTPGLIVILNGAPRSGKSSLALAIQEHFSGAWINLGVDAWMGMTPKRFYPGIGLRPGGERPDLEATIVQLYRALYESIAAHSRLGLNVVADVDHHDSYSKPLGILADCARRLEGLPAWLVGVHCPLEAIVARRAAAGWKVARSESGEIPEAVRRWQEEVHKPGIYDLEVDTGRDSPQACARSIRECLEYGAPPVAFGRLARLY